VPFKRVCSLGTRDKERMDDARDAGDVFPRGSWMGLAHPLRDYPACPVMDIRTDGSLPGAGTAVGHLSGQRLKKRFGKETIANQFRWRAGIARSKRAGQDASERPSLGGADSSLVIVRGGG